MNQGKIDFEQNLKLAIRLTGIKNVIPSILIVMITIILLSKIPFRNVFVPTDITDLSILSLENDDATKHYHLSTNGWKYTGYNTYKDKAVSEHIFYSLQDNQCYFLLVSPDFVDSDTMLIKKEIVNITLTERTDVYNSFLNNFALDINWNYDALSKICSPIILTSTSYNETFYKVLFVMLFIIIVLMTIQIIIAFSLILFPLLSRQFTAKHKHAPDDIRNRREFATYLQTELNDYLFKADKLYITNNYIINLSCGEIAIIPLNQLCMMFEHGNLRKFLWFYMKVTHTLYFLCKNTLKCHFKHKYPGNIDYIINMLKQICPDIMIGYSVEHMEKYLEITKGKS